MVLFLKNRDKKFPKLSQIADIKPVTTEQPKTATKSSKHIKQPGVITLQPETVEKPSMVDIT